MAETNNKKEEEIGVIDTQNQVNTPEQKKEKDEIIISLDVNNHAHKHAGTGELFQLEAYEKITELFNNRSKQYDDLKGNKKKLKEAHHFPCNIFVEGKRGTGKTTFILNIETYFRDMRGDELKNFRFFRPIDPTIVYNGKEKFLNIVISRIINDIESEFSCIGNDSDKANKLEELKKTFMDVSKSIESLESSDGHASGLEKIANEQSCLKLEERIHDFFLAVSEFCDNKVLVLLIDDVDMAFRNGFEVLETIRKYLDSVNIITVISGEYELYQKIVEKEFFNNLRKDIDLGNNIYLGGRGTSIHSRNIHEEDLEKTQELARQYLEKVFPSQQRVRLAPLSRLMKDFTFKIVVSKELEISLKDFINIESYIINGPLVARNNESLEIFEDNIRLFTHLLSHRKTAILRHIKYIKDYGKFQIDKRKSFYTDNKVDSFNDLESKEEIVQYVRDMGNDTYMDSIMSYEQFYHNQEIKGGRINNEQLINKLKNKNFMISALQNDIDSKGAIDKIFSEMNDAFFERLARPLNEAYDEKIPSGKKDEILQYELRTKSKGSTVKPNALILPKGMISKENERDNFLAQLFTINDPLFITQKYNKALFITAGKLFKILFVIADYQRQEITTSNELSLKTITDIIQANTAFNHQKIGLDIDGRVSRSEREQPTDNLVSDDYVFNLTTEQLGTLSKDYFSWNDLNKKETVRKNDGNDEEIAKAYKFPRINTYIVYKVAVRFYDNLNAIKTIMISRTPEELKLNEYIQRILLAFLNAVAYVEMEKAYETNIAVDPKTTVALTMSNGNAPYKRYIMEVIDKNADSMTYGFSKLPIFQEFLKNTDTNFNTDMIIKSWPVDQIDLPRQLDMKKVNTIETDEGLVHEAMNVLQHSISHGGLRKKTGLHGLMDKLWKLKAEEYTIVVDLLRLRKDQLPKTGIGLEYTKNKFIEYKYPEIADLLG